MPMSYRDFETIRNIDDKNQKESIKSIVDPLEGQVVNDNITVNDYNRDGKNISIPTNVIANVNNIMNDIINGL